MIAVRNHNQRGQTNIGWLKSYHTFSFGHYYNPEYKGFRDLLVINEDHVKPDQGFGTHPHKNMEILTYVVKGALRHEDSEGNQSILRANEFQRMSAGTGIFHSEYNHSNIDSVHFLQVWIKPDKLVTPSYEQKSFSGQANVFVLVASKDGQKNSLVIQQDVKIYLANLNQEKQITYHTDPKRHLWIQLISGSLTINDQNLQAGDGIAISEQNNIKIFGNENSQILAFDLA